ncbi:MAG TPA: hypothetical protein VFH66_08065 [Mycobacteriales bacterium]|nr:hypothetical protein [Mycobacteriales bacterium]
MRSDQLIALVAAVVLGGGVAVAATTTRADAPTAAPRPHVAKVSATPSRSATAAPHMATRAPRPAVTNAKPRHTARPVARRPLFPLPAPAAYPHPCPPPPLPPGPPFHAPKPSVKNRSLPAPVAVRAHHASLDPMRGKGMWLTTWADTHINFSRVVAQARAAGLHQLWIRTGGSTSGWYGARFLDRLLPQAHRAGLKVIAWDFPTLSDPVADAQRAALVTRGTFAGQKVDGFSPDIEEIYEGTFDTPRRVAVYLSRVRRDAGSLPIVATVLRPLDGSLSTRPYRAMAPYVDAFAPMVYWSCTEPGAAALSALRPLARLRPVHLIGQSYDMGPEGGRHGLPSAREIWRFLDVARRAGALGASLYVYDQTGPAQWRALGGYPWR